VYSAKSLIRTYGIGRRINPHLYKCYLREKKWNGLRDAMVSAGDREILFPVIVGPTRISVRARSTGVFFLTARCLR